MQRAQVNKGLLITLGVLIVIVGGYYAWQYASEPRITVDPNAPEGTYDLACEECKKVSSIKTSQLRSAELRDPNTLLYKCGHCGKFAARAERTSGGTALRPGTGG